MQSKRLSITTDLLCMCLHADPVMQSFLSILIDRTSVWDFQVKSQPRVCWKAETEHTSTDHIFNMDEIPFSINNF